MYLKNFFFNSVVKKCFAIVCCGTQEPVAVDQGDASIGIVEVATASVEVERNSRKKKN